MADNLIELMAAAAALDKDQFIKTVKSACFDTPVTDEQLFLFLSVARQYDLNPFAREIYAFVSKGKLQVIVGVDGWAKIINRHPAFDGMEFQDILAGSTVESITCRIHRKDRAYPTESTEYLVECRRNTDQWVKYPKRMLRHKAMIQAARYAFGFAGIIDPDEAERFADMRPVSDDPPPITLALDAPTASADASPSQSAKVRRGRPPKSQEPQAPTTTTGPTANPPAAPAAAVATCGYCHQPGHDFNSCPEQGSAETVVEAPQNGGRTLNDQEQAEIMSMAKLLRPKSAMSWLVSVLKKYDCDDLSELPADKMDVVIKSMQESA